MHSFAITFLGTGTSAGIPVIGCSCRVCTSTDPRDKRLRTSLLVQSPETSFVFDTSPDFRYQCLRAKLRKLDAVVYTHSHIDHIAGFDDLRRFCEMENRGMPIYADPTTMDALRRVFSYAFNYQGPPPKTYVRPEPVTIHGPFQLGHNLLIPTDLPHGKMTVKGFVLHRNNRKLLAYYTDCHDVPPAAIEAAKNAEILILDALRHTHHSTHLSIELAIHFALQIQARQTWLVHMCHEVLHAETDASLPPNVRLAYDTLRIEIPL